MIPEEAKTEVLEFLYSQYNKNSNLMYSIVPTASRLGIDAVELCTQLMDDQLIKPDAVISSEQDEVCCAISLKGIKKVDPDYVEQAIQKLLSGLRGEPGNFNVMQLLNLPSTDFQKGFDVANEIQNLDYIKILYVNFPKNLIAVEPTLKAKM